MKKIDKISIIMPAYNEEKRIGNTLKAYSSYFEKLKKAGILDYEILVVINGTTDRTEEVVKKYQKDNRKIFCLNLPRGGKGHAIIEGFREALKGNSGLISFLDADMSTKPEEFYNLLKRINGYDGVIASRYIPGAKINPKPTIGRILVSRIFNLLIRFVLLMPYRDTQCGAKIFKREPLAKTIPNITFSKWAFDVDLLYSFRKKGFMIKEIPTIWGDQMYSKINFAKAGPLMALAIIRLRLMNSPFKFMVKFYDSIMNFFLGIKR